MGKRKATALFSGLLISLASCCLFIYLLSLSNSEQQSKELSQFAAQLGYVPEAGLAEYETCWEIFSTECGLVLYFETSLNRDEMQQLIDQLSSEKELPKDIDGYSIFEINLETEHSFTINNLKDPLMRSKIPEPLAYAWWLTVDGNDWAVTIYLIQGDNNVYELDDRRITQNIVTIMLDTK